jgi:hypothetical protein
VFPLQLKRKYWWKNLKMMGILGCVIFVRIRAPASPPIPKAPLAPQLVLPGAAARS